MATQEQLTTEYPVKSRYNADENQIDEQADEIELIDLKTDAGYFETLKIMLNVGCKSFGGPMNQVEDLQKIFVDDLKWVNEELFTEIFTICCGIPGSVITQVAIAIGSLVTNNWKGGVFAFIGLTLPGALIMGLFGCIYRILQLNQLVVPCLGKLALHGFASASVSVVFQAAWKFCTQMKVSWQDTFIIGSSLVLYILYQSPIFMLALMIIGGFIMQMSQKEDYRTSVSVVSRDSIQIAEPRFSRVLQEQGGVFGKNSLYAYIIILAVLLILRISLKTKDVEAAISFYYVGSLLMGGGHVGIPLLFTEFTALNLITSDIFFNGFSVNNMIPGPIMNIAVYVGGFADGFKGAFIAYIFLYLPTFLFIWGVLPYWHSHRKDPNINNFIRGASLVSIGFVFATTYILWRNAGQDDVVTSSLLVVISFVLLNIYELPAPFVVLLGGVLMVVRYMTLRNYRGVEDYSTC
ncbi:chromate ion transporter (CHR) family chromate transporter (macronuclear) [Tetrahymena thermophila SB210]|uniref:Chromate ion transporter (CHR) family chromate transporter n=1 Tax=Tetrahymena thermophila (strain SB210) TaxID=312017 RepID=I7M4Q6_TETTS|nr:chromate ion transporter (CHR) family chromate transporter [Tetrahymena thermophila SB210]EAS07861.1 chromate ion transporter (CHR) family chromate transporter [Tetrahymena thermophila SB210]|eukprot:XP_001028103.1 chromate ion transporter (CHR) family chromate transporter [Tetrahymena thermophila SB210]